MNTLAMILLAIIGVLALLLWIVMLVYRETCKELAIAESSLAALRTQLKNLEEQRDAVSTINSPDDADRMWSMHDKNN